MKDDEYFEIISRDKVGVHWGGFTCSVGDSHNCWAYHTRPTHITEEFVDENGKKDYKQRLLGKDEPCPHPIYTHKEALRVAFQKYVAWKAEQDSK